MIASQKNDLLDSLFYLYFRRLARRAFHTIAARGLNHLRDLPADRPVIVFCNHTNWWDGILIYLLARHLPGKSAYCMMEEKQLRHYRFFTWLGAFSVDLDSPLRAAASLRYACRLLRQNRTALWIFPQGKLCPPHAPLKIRPGIYFLAQKTPNALLVPIALRYDFFREDRPNALIEIAPPFPSTESSPERLAAECNLAIARVTQASRDQDLSGFTPLFPPIWPINKRWEWFKRALTGRLRDFNLNN